MSVQAEVEKARESERVLALMGRGLACIPQAYAFGVSEDAAERYAIRAQDAAAGLVSIPTSDTHHVSPAPFRLKAQAQALQKNLSAFSPDPVSGRIARLRRSVGCAARCIEALKPEVQKVRTVMVTLTYRGTNADWAPWHITEFLKRVRAWMYRRDQHFRYVWVAELQKRGVIHYHVALWLPQGLDLPMPDKCGWWTHGMSRIETARHAVGYLMKYLTKGNDAAAGTLPDHARSHGRGGLGSQFRAMLRWLSLPAFIKARASVDDRWTRAAGGGWTDPDGVIWPSEFERIKAAGQWCLKRVRDHGRPFNPDGAFSWFRPNPCAQFAPQAQNAHGVA